MSIFDKLQDIDIRIIYLLAMISVFYPLISPMGLPIKIGAQSTKWYNYLNTIPDGSVVLFSPNFGASSLSELLPMTVATLHHLWSKNVKVVVVAFWADGPIMFRTAKGLAVPESYGKVYGKDYIELGFVPNGETGMNNLGKDVLGTCSVDYVNNRPTRDYDIMKNIKVATDFNLVISIESGTPGFDGWARQWETVYKVKFIVGCVGVSIGGMQPYVNSGQIQALMPGLSPSAEYELLIKKPGLGIASTDAITMSHYLVIAFVIIGNVAYFLSKLGGKKDG
ncbi:hypothetical protein FJY84_02250 [Candidatus Bathyarchaeota archaeon]|nr:hypothetical protein [Candidatus Bathyarchaeota archaeon]